MTLKEMLSADKFAHNAGAEIVTIESGYAKVKMKVTAEHLNAGGVCQGGALFTLADLAFAAVANSHKRLTLSLTTTITFLKAVKEGYVYAEATEVFNHARVPYVEVRITDDTGSLIAIFNSSGYRKSEELPIEGLE